MARPLRIEYPGAFYHVINRGNANEKIFLSDRDREKFLEYLKAATERYSLLVHSYCLMDNHYHLIVETPEPNISKAMQWLNVSYAVYFNTKRKRRGHLFQGRFKAMLIDAEEYLLVLARYIHLNPVRAGIASSPEHYTWSSYNALIGRNASSGWLEVDHLLGCFHKSRKKAIQLFREFCEDINMTSLQDPSKEATQGFILGKENFVRQVQEKLSRLEVDEREIPQLRKLKPRPTIDAIVEEVSSVFGCQAEDIMKVGKKRNTAREVAIYLSQLHTGLPGKMLGNYFGQVTGARIAAVSKKVQSAINAHGGFSELKKKVEKVIARIVNN